VIALTIAIVAPAIAMLLPDRCAGKKTCEECVPQQVGFGASENSAAGGCVWYMKWNPEAGHNDYDGYCVKGGAKDVVIDQKKNEKITIESPTEKTVYSFYLKSKCALDFGKCESDEENENKYKCDDSGKEFVLESKPLGVGAQKSVYKGRHEGKDVAIAKVLMLDDISPFHLHSEEVHFETLVKRDSEDSKYITRLIGSAYAKDEVSDEVHQYMIYELGAGDLKSTELASIEGSSTPMWKRRVQWALDTAKGLRFMHKEMGFVHRDVKGLNVLRFDDDHAKLTDIEMSRYVGEDVKGFDINSHKALSTSSEDTEARMTGWMGTPGFIAPEVMKDGKSTYGFSSDVYSFGVLLLGLLTGKLPTNILKDATEVSQLTEVPKVRTLQETREMFQDKLLPAKLPEAMRTMPKLEDYKNLMYQCLLWDGRDSGTHGRPSSSELVERLEGIISEDSTEYLVEVTTTETSLGAIANGDSDTFRFPSMRGRKTNAEGSTHLSPNSI